MRAYLATSPKQIKDLLSSGSAFFTEYLSPEQFEFPEEVGVEELVVDVVVEQAVNKKETINNSIDKPKSSFLITYTTSNINDAHCEEVILSMNI